MRDLSYGCVRICLQRTIVVFRFSVLTMPFKLTSAFTAAPTPREITVTPVTPLPPLTLLQEVITQLWSSDKSLIRRTLMVRGCLRQFSMAFYAYHGTWMPLCGELGPLWSGAVSGRDPVCFQIGSLPKAYVDFTSYMHPCLNSVRVCIQRWWTLIYCTLQSFFTLPFSRHATTPLYPAILCP